MEFDIFKMLYKTEKYNSKVRILGHIFVKNIRAKGKLIINNRRKAITESINTDSKFIKNNEFKIKLLLIKNISDKSYFFKECTSLLKLSMTKKGEKFDGNKIMYNDENEDEKFFDIYPKEKNSRLYDYYEGREKYDYLNISEISKTEKISDIY